MGLDVDLNLASKARSPSSEFSLQAQGRSFPTKSLNDREAERLQNQMNSLVTEFDSSMLTHLLKQREDTIANAAAFAKQEFDEKLFGGLNAGDNEIGFDVLRPGHIRADPATGDAENDWYFDASQGWNDWIGDGTSANNFTANEDEIVLILGFIDQDPSSEVSAVNIDEFGRNVDMIPKDLNGLRLRDNETELQAAAMPSLLIQENEQAHVRLRYDRAVESQPRLFGFTFGLGTYMNAEDY